MRKSTCFLICPIGEKDSDTRKHSDKVMEYLIHPVLDAISYTLTRSDLILNNSKIDVAILDHLKKDQLAIADITGVNPNVYFELGYRSAYGLPVITIAEEGTKIPFDIYNYRTLFYDLSDIESCEKFKKSMKEIIINIEAELINHGLLP